MPKANFPMRGGPSPAFWQSGNSAPAAGSEFDTDSRVAARASRTDADAFDRQAMEAEIQRLRGELARARGDSNLSPVLPQMPDRSRMVFWAALALAGFGMLFAVFAVLNHG